MNTTKDISRVVIALQAEDLLSRGYRSMLRSEVLEQLAVVPDIHPNWVMVSSLRQTTEDRALINLRVRAATAGADGVVLQDYMPGCTEPNYWLAQGQLYVKE